METMMVAMEMTAVDEMEMMGAMETATTEMTMVVRETMIMLTEMTMAETKRWRQCWQQLRQ